MRVSTWTQLDDDSGQSSVVSVVILVGITLALASAIVLVGSSILTDVQQTTQTSQAEQAMLQLESRASLVAFSGSASQNVHLDRTGSGQVNLDPDAGRIDISTANDTGTRTIVNESLGALRYQSGDTTIAYQGGGLWRKQDDGTVMLSPPEYQYRDHTLTLPIVTVTGDEWAGTSNKPLTVKSRPLEQVYPNGTNENLLDERNVTIEVTSEFHRGWKEFFETRTEGAISHDPANETVTVTLTVPHTETFDNAVTATSGDSDAVDESSTSSNGGFDSPNQTGVDRPSSDRKIEHRIEDCESSGCTDLGSAGATLTNGTYYQDGDTSLGSTTYDTSSGDVHVVVDGDLEYTGTGPGPHHEVSGDGTVTFYVRGDIEISGDTEVNTGGDPADLLALVHSDGSDVASASGTPQFTGLIYAPSASLTINGGGNPSHDNFVGSVIVRNATAHGNGNLVHSSVDVGLEFDPVDDIEFLHVTRTPIEIDA